MSDLVLFDRKVKLTIAKPIKGSFTKAEPNATVITDLRVSFKIEKKLQKNPNTAEIVIYNLNEASRALLQKKPLQITLEAGYEGSTAVLWLGDMTFSSSKLEGVNWMTTIEVANGARAFEHARVNRSFPAGTGMTSFITEITSKMGLGTSIPPELQADLGGTLIKHATAIRGRASKSLDKTLKPQGLEWSIQDNQVQILRPNQLRADQAWLISESTGLIGSPDFNAPKKPGEKPVLKCNIYLHAGLVPGQKIRVESRAIQGVFRLEAVTHTGDTRDKAWFSEIEAKPV